VPRTSQRVRWLRAPLATRELPSDGGTPAPVKALETPRRPLPHGVMMWWL